MKFTTYLCSSVTSVMEFSEQGLTIVYRSDKGQLISKCLFGVLTFFQKTNKTSQQVVKSNLFVRFLEEMLACKNHLEFV